MSELERTSVLLKPSRVDRGLIGKVISRFERKGLLIRELRMLEMRRELADRLYEVHEGVTSMND